MARGSSTVTRWFSTAPTKFVTAFDSECALHITRKLEMFPVQLKYSHQYGNGLFATRMLRRGEAVFRELPLLSFPQRMDNDKRVSSVANGAPDSNWRADFSLVAQAVAIIIDAPDNPQGASFVDRSIPLRCLGWSSFTAASPEFLDYKVVREALFPAITSHFNLHQQNLWKRGECQVLYDKIKTNMFRGIDGAQEDVFEAASMLNHSCVPNVRFNPYKPDEVQAVREIAQGEQLFISYMVEPEDLPELYGFKCACERCAR